MGWVGFGYGFWCLRRKRTIENIPRSKIKGMPMGIVEVHGVAKIEEPLIAPVSKIAAVYFHLEIQELKQSSKRRSWVTIYSDNSSKTEFFVEDETGRVRVKPEKAEISVEQKQVWKGSEIPSRVFEILNAQGTATTTLFGFSRTYRVIESVISPGAQLYVLGTATTREKMNPMLPKQIIASAYQTLKTNKAAMAALDLNQDGRVDAVEWEQGQKWVENQTREQLTALTRDAMIAHCANHPFLISTHSEKELIKQYSRKAFFGIFGGPLLAIVGFLIVIARWD